MKYDFRVRAVTRYVVTSCAINDDEGSTAKHSTSPVEMGVYTDSDTASRVARSLAAVECINGGTAEAFPWEGPPPGKVMRCKVTLNNRVQAWKSADGSWKVDDPTKIVGDGAFLSFSAVCPPTCNSAPNASPENAIFGEFTPSFTLTCHVRNEDVLEALERGRDYYVDFTPAPQA